MLYLWDFFASSGSLISGLSIGGLSVTAALATIAIAAISYIWSPKKYFFEIALANFYLLTAMTALLVYETGQASSPFLALWMVVGVFSGIFGLLGIGPYAVLVSGFLVYLFMHHDLSLSTFATTIFAGIIPIGLSYVIWHGGPKKDASDQAYRQLENEFSQVAGKSEVVINAIADGVIAVNASGVIELINPAAQQIIGWGKQDAVGLDYRSVLKLTNSKNEELDDATDPVAQVLATNKQVANNNLVLITNSGKKILVSLLISPVGQIGSGAIVVFRDITREKAEERQQAEFISTASHEMRTPVASIEGYLGLALNPATAQIDEKARDYIQKAHESAQHLGRLFQDLLDVSRADDGRLQNEPKVINVTEFCHDIVEGLRPKAEEKGLRLTYKPKPDDEPHMDRSERSEKTVSPIYYVNVDPDHLREVVANLVENAIKYTLHGDVIVDISGDPENVEISIKDSGIGIPPEDISHLFQKFYRVDNSETREIGGTGLGLYLCRRLAEAMNGRIWAESQYQRGSTFFLSVPRLANDDAQRIIEQASAEPAHIIPARTMAPMPSTDQPAQSTDAMTAPEPQPQPQQPLQPAAQPVMQPSATPSQPAVNAQPMEQPQAPVQPQPQQPAMQQPTYAAPAPQQSYAPRSPGFANVGTPTPVQKRPLGQMPAQARVNTPLSQIEQNKAAFVSQRPDSVNIPGRDASGQYRN